MNGYRMRFLPALAILLGLFPHSQAAADLIPVHHPLATSLAFLVLRTLDGQPIAYGNLKLVVEEKKELVVEDLQFRFKDGSFFEEITKFTQHDVFRLISDQVVQKGPSFKQESETFLDATTGNVMVRTVEKGKEKTSNKHLDLPPDVSNGLVLILAFNLDPSAAETTVSMVAASGPRVVKLNISPGQEKLFKTGAVTYHAQHYVVKTKVQGVAGVVAPLIGKVPPDIHIWILKSEAPAFMEFEGPLSPDSPVWRIELASPEAEPAKEASPEKRP